MVVFMFVNFRTSGYWWVLAAILTVGFSNFVSSDLIKGNVERLRPCNDPANFAWIRIIEGLYLPKSSSFTSSHAANHFAIAFFIFHTLKTWLPKLRYLFLVWAGIIVYAQMYVGVHYPSDILCGALIGWFIGTLSSKIFQKNVQLA
jgi:undecaprenyl-diphosphatase